MSTGTSADTSAPTDASSSFPRRAARTSRFTLGAPRAVTVSPDGSRVLFLRSRGGTDRVGCLWLHTVATGEEQIVVDPRVLLADDGEQLSTEERARRERLRESGAGVVGYATDTAVRVVALALSGRLVVAALADRPVDGGGHDGGGQDGGGQDDGDSDDGAVRPGPRLLDTAVPVLDPRPDPTGRSVAYVAAGALRVVGVDGTGDRALAEPDGPDVTWGLAEFVAAEEMDRHRGFWWAPDGQSLLAARVDESPVQRWHLADPARPEAAPVELAYPAAGTPNAVVTLALLGLDGSSRAVDWDRARFPYLVTVHWSRHGAPLLLVMTRDQRRAQVLAVDVDTGWTSPVREDTDPVWLDVVTGVPAWLPDGRLLTAADQDDTRRLCVDGTPVTPVGLQVEGVLDVDDDGVLVAATDEPTEAHLWHLGLDGELRRLTDTPGVHRGRRGGGVLVRSSASLDADVTEVTLVRDGMEVGRLPSVAERPGFAPRVVLLRAGERALRTALLLPAGWEPGASRLPVLLDPYGGPHAQRVVAARSAYLTSQWFADQGFAVIVADGRGTPARGPAWERAIAGTALADVVLADQVDALHAVAEGNPDLDLTRVGIRGWSFGGYLAALAVLRRPDVFAAAVAGAPVTDWALYDTFYTERYLGLPAEAPDAYARASLLGDAARLERPLLVVHGLADDNVVAAHSLRLSSALLAAGRPHTFLPLSGVTHMTPQEVVAENLLLLQARFLKDALGAPPSPPQATIMQD